MKNDMRERKIHRHAQQEQLCKLILALPQRKLPQQRIESQFDDRAISGTPQAQMNGKASIVKLKPQSQEGDQERRRQRIKIKIKSQVREKIKQLAARQFSFLKPAEISPRGRSHFLSVQARSDIFGQKPYEGSLGSILGKCVAEQIQLRQKENFHQTKYRSRLISTSQRSHPTSSLNCRQLPNAVKFKMSTPHLEVREVVGEGVEPWRYSEDLPAEQATIHHS